ncbi:hypothetical protein ILUMI_23596 [Ignelater luminosus]|uniref:Uncharacterized protein n=1 Tax=Ignelater luminosus TaxID=2038154 RepID=A0A8K0C8I0_IGNLU|nr:hypothetical protein ILUMI_23596 [Ignelater luminosus]
MVMGDLNGRVRSNHAACKEVIGRYGECPSVLSRNGKSILELCVANDLTAANTFYLHKRIHQYTRTSKKRNEKSIIDYYILVMDVRVRKGMELGTDHHFLKVKLKMSNGGTINYYKLRSPEAKEEFVQDVEQEMINQAEALGEATFKTKWWNDEVKREIKFKKGRFREYLRVSEDEKTAAYSRYKEQRRVARNALKRAQEQSWEEFGRKMEEDCEQDQKLFYRVLKNMIRVRCHIKQIKAKTEKELQKEREMMER